MTGVRIVGQGEADSVAAHKGGWSATISDTTPHAIDLSAWVGRYVKIAVQGQTVYYVWTALVNNAVPVSPVIVTGASTTAPVSPTFGNVGVADFLPAGGWSFEVPSDDSCVLVYQAAASGAQITVLPK